MAKVEQDQRNGSRLQPGLGEYGSTPGNLGNLRATDAGFDSAISSPPFAEQQSGGGLAKPNAVHSDGHQFGDNHGYQNQADTDGNLAALRATDAGFSAAVSSPPYADGAQHTGGDDPKPEHIEGGELRYVDYGQSAGQLAAMRSDGFDGAVSSPPYEEALSLKGGRQRAIAFNDPDKAGFADMPSTGTAYSASNDNIGNSSGDDFWSAARAIVEQTYAVLRPGAHAVWIVKSFVRAGALVDFPGQWRQLCEACGFVTLHEHHALLVREDGTQLAMDGNHKRHRKERKSFFRRMAEFNAQAVEFWRLIDSRSIKARYVRESHRALWEQYRADLIDLKEDEESAYPTRTRIMSSARASAYRDAGAPPMDIETRIDHETVYCMVKEA